MTETVAELEGRIRRATQPGFEGRLLDRGLARGLIWRDGELPPEAPPFSDALTEDLLDFGHTLLAMTLRLRDASRDHPELPKAFLVAGEAIEAAVHQGDPQRLDGAFYRVTAAVSFHLARYAARAYSVLPAGTQNGNLSPSEKALALLLRRHLDGLHDTVTQWLLNPENHDEGVAARLAEQDGFHEDDAIHVLLTTALMRGLALFDHALVTGRASSATRARENLAMAAAVAADLHAVSHWWTLSLASHLVDDLWEHSLHQRLPTLPPDHAHATWNDVRRDYITRLRRNSRSAIELWPSQTEGAARAITPNDDLVVALPTSAGKTRVAELCIMRCLAGGQRVVYVTPLRALSAQVERDLSSTFGPLGYAVSSLYGSAGIEAGDADTLRENKIVVSTPEKLDFAIRNDPDIIDDVGLVILDEGHMLGPDEREVRYEALVQRLLRRPDAGSRRLLCLSALFPEVEKMRDLVAWIRRDVPGLPVHSYWRPTRQRFGWIRWEGRAARLQVKVEGEESYVPRFVEARRPPRGKRTKDFPKDKNELTLASAWQFVSQDKDVLVYSPLKKSVETLGELVLTCVRQGVLPSLGKMTSRVREAMAAGAEWLGSDHPAVGCLEHGVALHHGGLPRQFLAHVEAVLRAGDCRITIASPTLAQGLNLSASVLLVPSIWRKGEVIPAVEFTNVAGRAGRAFVDLEGLVLHVIWEEDRGKARWSLDKWEELLATAKASAVRSGLLDLAVSLFIRIAETANIPHEEVVEYVLGQDRAWDYVAKTVPEGETDLTEAEWERSVASLDAAVLALLDAGTSEDALDGALDEVLQGSLFTRQLARQNAEVQALVRRFVAARARRIWSGTSPAQRRGYHVAGVGLRAGTYLDSQLDALVRLLVCAEAAIASSEEDVAAKHIADFAGLVFPIAPFHPLKLPPTWREALVRWLKGQSAAAVVQAGGEDGVDFLQDGIMYRLAWAMEAVRVHALAVGHADAEAIEGVAAMAVEAGSADRSVITLLRAGLDSRDAARAAVESTGATFSNRSEMMTWLWSDKVQALHRDEKWPTPEARSAWVRFVDSTGRGEGRRWRHDRQKVRVEWLEPNRPPATGTDVIVETDKETKLPLVLLPDFTMLGRVKTALSRPRRDIVDARVGQRPDTVEIEYFGPQTLEAGADSSARRDGGA